MKSYPILVSRLYSMNGEDWKNLSSSSGYVLDLIEVCSKMVSILKFYRDCDPAMYDKDGGGRAEDLLKELGVK